MNEFIATLLRAALVVAVLACAAFIDKGLKALAAYLGQKVENETAKKYLAAVADAVATAVTFTSQTYVDELKKAGTFDKAAQDWALQVALAQAQRMLTEEAKAFLTEAYGDLTRYLEGRIEAEVRNQKIGVGTLTLSA